MAIAANNPFTFTLFPRLAPELRNKIWRNTLPDVGPALYFYKKGCWCPRRLSESDEGYNPENDELNLNFEFFHNLLYDTQFEVPLAFINHEARSIALDWARNRSMDLRPRKGGQHPVFVRHFDPARDVLYVALEDWNDFLYEADERMHQPDLEGEHLSCGSYITRIAVPEAVLQNKADTLTDIFRWFLGIEVLFVVIDTQPDLQSADKDMNLQQWWDFEKEGGAFYFHPDRVTFDFVGSKHIGNEALYRLIEDANKHISAGLVSENLRSFEVRPISAARR